MNAAVVKKTQDTLGKVIKKPPLTEKLLSRPPFRYLHDIFSEVIRTTGFMKGLYEEKEMKSDSVKEKDSKIAFLQKAIDVVMLVSGEPLAAKPARIVAGHEPEKTNELLQAIARCCLNKLSSDDAVKRVLAGEKVDLKTKASSSRSQGKENREGKDRQLDKEEKKKIERSGSREQKDAKQPKEQESRHRDKEDHRDHERTERQHHSEQEHLAKHRDKDKSQDRERERDKDRDKGRARDKDRDRDRDRDKDKTRERDSHRDRERGKEKRTDKDRERHKDWDEKNRSGDRENDKARESGEPQQKPRPEEQSSKSAKTVPASDSPARIPRPSSAKGQRRKAKVGINDESDSEGDGDVLLAQRQVPQENGDSEESSVPTSDKTSRRIARPSSARPAPPRVKRQESNAEGTPSERLSSAKPPAPIIMDGKRMSEDEEDDDEQFLVVEAVPPLPDVSETEREPAQELDTDEKHGGLVKKILETKKDYEVTPSPLKSKEQNLVSETARKKEREQVTREIERLHSSIQMVCRSSLPLGKIMDYIQEDVDAMQAELQGWRRENKEHAQALLQEQRATDRAVEPLKAELAELEQLIKDHQDKICAVKSNILKNEEKIQKMVTGINFSSRT
ncbi:TRAF3-interacting protein 1 isoform X2 [Girardinichthys multiradiatus]|uniref:TRAF3-interacting protein 1 isoform X2 n=1 Tax=Girardinichthys multiradiatus TaxID=208333 RepID=UPI001FAC2708|nr:TRAF3-interacting protein 1 isoform X2 [Girardinichthys multiradiatus]